LSSQKPGSGGVEEKQALIDRINQNQELFTPDEQKSFLSEAQNLSTGNGGPADIQGQQTRAGIADFTNRLNQRAQERARELADRRAKIQAQLQAMTDSPGAKQTTNTDLLQSQGGLLTGANEPAIKLTTLAQPVVPNLTGTK
jgi:hypothetical protein